MNMINIINHVSVLYVLTPLFGGLFSAICFNANIARSISIVTIAIDLYLSITNLKSEPTHYAFGNFVAPIGIEYLLDSLNKPIIVYINFILLFLLLFCHKLIKELVLDHLKNKYKHLFYAILLFAHTGYMGMLSTNDLFNLYVFIEISSLSAYVLLSLGNNPKSIVGALDYLIMGSIGASLILIAIGLLFSITGSLNISDMHIILTQNNTYSSKIIACAASFFIIGSILKMAFFPINFWMIRAYNYSSPIILVYLAAISSVIGVYIFLRFVYFVLDYEQINNILSLFLSPIALIAIIICSLLAIWAKTLRTTIIYSGALSVSYIIFFLVQHDSKSILFQLLFIDNLNKIGLFLITAYYDSNNYRLKNIKFGKYLIAIILICSSGLPISAMFIVKINILQFLFSNNLLPQFIIFIVSFCFSLIYIYKIAIILFLSTQGHDGASKKIIAYDLIAIVTLQFLLVVYFNELVEFTKII